MKPVDPHLLPEKLLKAFFMVVKVFHIAGDWVQVRANMGLSTQDILRPIASFGTFD